MKTEKIKEILSNKNLGVELDIQCDLVRKYSKYKSFEEGFKSARRLMIQSLQKEQPKEQLYILKKELQGNVNFKYAPLQNYLDAGWKIEDLNKQPKEQGVEEFLKSKKMVILDVVNDDDLFHIEYRVLKSLLTEYTQQLNNVPTDEEIDEFINSYYQYGLEKGNMMAIAHQTGMRRMQDFIKGNYIKTEKGYWKTNLKNNKQD